MLALTIYRELKLQAWEKSPGMRAVDYYSRSRLDLLGSVANMISGYPERAEAFFHQQLADLRVQEYRAYLNDYLALQESQPGNRLAIG